MAHGTSLSLDDAVDVTRTGDLWLFRGRSAADQAIRTLTNSPVNHVGMAVVLDDLPALMWHAELGRGVLDVWTGTRHRGVQLHDLREAVEQWTGHYRQRAWLRQLEPPVGPEQEAAVLTTIARLDGTPFPSTAALAGRWLRGRLRRRAGRQGTVQHVQRMQQMETAYCAEVVAATYQAMGLLGDEHPTGYYDPGSFWSGDELLLRNGARLGAEVRVDVGPDGSGRGPDSGPRLGPAGGRWVRRGIRRGIRPGVGRWRGPRRAAR